MFNSLSQRSRAMIVSAAALTFAPAIAPTNAHAAVPPISAPADSADSDGDADQAEPVLLDACPLDGSATFQDSWGWARSGGRSHEGVDMIAERGVPVIAVRDGDAQFKTNRLGGNAVWLTTADGDKFYYAHLDRWEGESRTVRAGDVIGYVGSSGNAQGSHLHFETLPDGDVENPFPHTFRACVPDFSQAPLRFPIAPRSY